MDGKLPFRAVEKPEKLACVKEFIGKRLQGAGIVCPCPKCRQERGEPEEESCQPSAVSPQQAPRDAKMRAANDDSDQENSTEEADRIYLDRMRRRNQE
jgi:hypothetical protein